MARRYADLCIMVVDLAESQPWCRTRGGWNWALAATGVRVRLRRGMPHPPVLAFGQDGLAGVSAPAVLGVAAVGVITHQTFRVPHPFADTPTPFSFAFRRAVPSFCPSPSPSLCIIS